LLDDVLTLDLKLAAQLCERACVFSVREPSLRDMMVPCSRLVLANIVKARLVSSISQVRSPVASASDAAKAMETARNVRNFRPLLPIF